MEEAKVSFKGQEWEGLPPFGLNQVPGARWGMMVLSISLPPTPSLCLNTLFCFFGQFKLLYVALYQGAGVFFIFPTTVFPLLSNKAGHDNS